MSIAIHLSDAEGRQIMEADGLFPVVETITPEIARELLATCAANRTIRRKAVDKYARDMRAGRWELNGEAIKIGVDGRMIDGEHRCIACLDSQTPFTSVVIRNVPNSVRPTMDTGMRRLLSDVLTFHNEKNTAILAGAVTLGWKHDNGLVESTMAPSTHEALEWLANHPRIREAVKHSDRLRKSPLSVLPSVASLFLYRVTTIDPELAEEFFTALVDGVNLQEDNPIFALRRWLLHVARTVGRYPQSYYLAVLIKTWNAWVTRRPMRIISFKQTEGFPVLIDPVGEEVVVTSSSRV